MDSHPKDSEDDEGASREEPKSTPGELNQPSSREAKVANQTASAEVGIHPANGSKDAQDTKEKRANSESSSTTEASGAPKTSVTSSAGVPQDGSLPPKKPKKDRSNLRKGKWTVEEEEYTSRIIHYFSTGLLTLPEGATLRSYLADKLNCDPMRITKKYAGASCLGRRAHQFRDRSTPTVTEIQLAKAELDHLEQRFRMRVEDGYSSMPMNPPPEIMFSLAQQANQFLINSMAAPPPPPQPAAAQNLLPPWLFALNQQQPPVVPPPPPAAPAVERLAQNVNGLSEQAKVLSSLASLGAALPWLLPGSAGNTAPPLPSPPANTGVPDATTMASWAFAQAAASLAPAITQLAAANLQQTLQQPAPKPAPSPALTDPIKELSARLQESRDADSLKQALQAAMAGRPPIAPAQAPSSMLPTQPAVPIAPSGSAMPPGQRVGQVPIAKRPDRVPIAAAAPKPAAAATIAPPSRPPPAERTTTLKRVRSDEDKQAGDILLGFLSSLRHSYEEALKEKEDTVYTPPSSQQPNRNNSTQRPPATLQEAVRNTSRRPGVAQVSDISSGVSSSTGQPESSLEESDWHSDKKTETSSSEDSDKEVNGSSGKGPPRKRLKTKRAADERQREASRR